MKSSTSRLHENIIEIQCPFQLLLTGTPLQNNLHELWALLRFLLPDREVGLDAQTFVDCFDLNSKHIDPATLGKARTLLGFLMMRRTKAEVTPDLPPKTEINVYVPMTGLQTKWYQRLLSKDDDLLGGLFTYSQFMYMILQLRKVCNHPAMLTYKSWKEKTEEREKAFRAMKAKQKNREISYKEWDSDDEEDNTATTAEDRASSSPKNDQEPETLPNFAPRKKKEFKIGTETKEGESITADVAELRLNFKKVEDLIEGSGKMILLHQLLVRLKSQGSRVLIFSQFTSMLDILGQYLVAQDWQFKRLDGSTNRIVRELDVRDFNAPESPYFVYLISTRAGGLGINLATADTVVLFDSDWNPQNDLQAMARAHRIGQTKEVRVYRLITENTVEEKIVQRAQRKLFLDAVVVQSEGASGGTRSKTDEENEKLTPQEMLSMLKFGAGKTFKSKGCDPTKMDLDDMLKKSSERTNPAHMDQDDVPEDEKDMPEIFKAFADFIKNGEDEEDGKENKRPALMVCPECKKENKMANSQKMCHFCNFRLVAATSRRHKKGEAEPDESLQEVNVFAVDTNLGRRKRKATDLVYVPGDWRLREDQKKPKLRHEDFCYVCDDGGELVQCVGCPKVYHTKCVGLRSVPKGSWYCPWHECYICQKRYFDISSSNCQSRSLSSNLTAGVNIRTNFLPLLSFA